MGIGGGDYSHRWSQRSSLRELGEVERGQRRSGVGHGLCVAKASGGLGHPRWIRSLAYRRRHEPTRPQQHHLAAEQPRSIAVSESDRDRRWQALREKSLVPSA